MRLQVFHSHPVTVGEALQQAVITLTPTSPTPRLDTEVLLMHARGRREERQDKDEGPRKEELEGTRQASHARELYSARSPPRA